MSDDETRAAIERFNDAFNRQDLDGVGRCITDDCVFVDTSPPDGQRYQGRAAVLAAWREFFAGSPDARFDTEELTVSADRAVVRWQYRWRDGRVRGVDLMRVRDGQVAEKLAYVKG
jgi:uncharacterized protein (TIGR02246 family)